MRITGILSAISLLTAATLAAQEPPQDQSKVVRMGEYVVESNTLERDVVRNPGLESASLEIASSSVERLQLELQSARTLTEAIEFAPGVFTETRGRKEKSFSSFRGQIYPYPDYALNGIWQREFHDFASVFPAAAIERVEIMRSSGALAIGPNSGLVGAINLIPRRFAEPTTVFDASYGTYASSHTSVVTGDSTENAYYTLGGTWWSTDGPDDENATERMLSFFAHGGIELPDGLRLEATGFYARGHRELRIAQPPAAARTIATVQQFDPNTYFGGTVRAVLDHSDDASTELTLGYVRRDPVVDTLSANPPKAIDESDWEYMAGLVHAGRLAEDNTLRVGVQWNQWVCPEGKRSYVGSEMDVHTFSGFVIDEQQLGQLTLDGGIRYTRSYYNKYTQRTFNITGSNLKSFPVENEWDDPLLTATLGAKYALNDTTQLFAHLAAGTIDAPVTATANDGDELTSETRFMVDAGVRFDWPEWGMLKVGAFVTDRRDAIVMTTATTTVDGESVAIFDNLNVRHYGVELEARSAKLWNKVEVFASATLMNSTERHGGDYDDRREIPDQILTAGVYGKFGRFDVNLFGKYVSGYENSRFAEKVGGLPVYHDLGDFTDMNLTAGYNFGQQEQTRVYVSLENLLDDEYSTVNGYPDYGLLVSVGLRHVF